MADEKKELVFGLDLETERLRDANNFIREREKGISDKKAFTSLAHLMNYPSCWMRPWHPPKR